MKVRRKLRGDPVARPGSHFACCAGCAISLQVKGDGFINQDIASQAMAMMRVDELGFDTMDRRLLNMIIENFEGGPVGVESIAAALSEERGTIEDVIEPFLIQQGYISRTARGRMATAKAYRHLGLKLPKSREADLFDEED